MSIANFPRNPKIALIKSTDHYWIPMEVETCKFGSCFLAFGWLFISQGFWWFYYGESHSKITKSLESGKIFKTFFRVKKKNSKTVFDIFFTSKFRFGRLIPAILVDQKFIILQGLHILGKIQVASPPPSEDSLNNRLHITVCFKDIYFRWRKSVIWLLHRLLPFN